MLDRCTGWIIVGTLLWLRFLHVDPMIVRNYDQVLALRQIDWSVG
jgi:hypothetical protein